MSEQFDPSEGWIGPLISLLLVLALLFLAWWQAAMWIIGWAA